MLVFPDFSSICFLACLIALFETVNRRYFCYAAKPECLKALAVSFIRYASVSWHLILSIDCTVTCIDL